MGLEDIQLETLAPHVGERFEADFGDQGTLDLELVEAKRRPTGSDGDIAFALLFRGSTDRVFEQGMVELSHAAIGREPIFLVAVGQTDEGRLYEAVFTRIAG